MTKEKNELYLTTKVHREGVEGWCVPAVIHNGGYYFTHLLAYQNGRIHDWNFEDWEHFKKDVKQGWVVKSIPNGENIHIHGLGKWKIKEGKWLFKSKDAFIHYVEEVVRTMNPKMENLHQYQEKIVNGVRYGERGNGIIYKENHDTLEKIEGKSLDLFYQVKDIFYVVQLNIFKDGSLQLARLETPIDLTLEAFEKLVKQRKIRTSLPKNAPVVIYGLGSFVVEAKDWNVKISDKVSEIKEILRKLRGEPTLFELCQQAYETYLQKPTAQNRQRLQEAYEQVPSHERMYLGDMDTKDTIYRMIIYGKQEIENWSHYLLAKHLGQELPSITLPEELEE